MITTATELRSIAPSNAGCENGLVFKVLETSIRTARSTSLPGARQAVVIYLNDGRVISRSSTRGVGHGGRRQAEEANWGIAGRHRLDNDGVPDVLSWPQLPSSSARTGVASSA